MVLNENQNKLIINFIHSGGTDKFTEQEKVIIGLCFSEYGTGGRENLAQHLQHFIDRFKPIEKPNMTMLCLTVFCYCPLALAELRRDRYVYKY